jgi:Zinc carboxypeptidase
MQNPEKIKKSVKGAIIFLLIFASASLQLQAQNQYNDFGAMSGKLKLLSEGYPSVCSLRSLTTTTGGKAIWVLTIGSGKKDDKPGIAVFGGVEGDHILGKELALGFAGSLLKKSSSEEIRELLDKVTFYVFPDVSPDATEQYFSRLKYERIGNARSTDDDRDFVFDEDGYEDLNNDGLITLFRVADPSGKYIKSHEDDRIMVEADPGMGETGNYLVYSEGIDNDKDGLFNEDGPGGVDFNRNFSFNYEAFGPKAGMHPVSEPEAIAVADFLFDRFNIYAVITFGPQDNLGQPMKSSAVVESDGVIKSVMKDDETINKLVSDRYHEITGVKGAPPEKAVHGDFMNWAYFHYGRYSFSTPAWWINAEKGQNPEVAFMKYAEANKIDNVFVPWTEVSHPDFPGRKAEVGGIRPFVMTNPPADSLDNLIDKNFRFITAIAAMHPELELLDIKAESAGEGLFRVSLKVHNKGIFATCAKIGEDNMWTRIMRISLEPVKGQTILSGRKIQKVERLEGDQTAEFSWLINGTGRVKVTAGALNTGTVSSVIELR